MRCHCGNAIAIPITKTRGRPRTHCSDECRRIFHRHNDSDDDGTILGAFRIVRILINGQQQLVTIPR